MMVINNARASFTPDGQRIVMLNRQSHLFNVGILDLNTGYFRVVTNSGNDHESPSVAPNGSMILYGTIYGGRGILGMVASDGSVEVRLPAVMVKYRIRPGRRFHLKKEKINAIKKLVQIMLISCSILAIGACSFYKHPNNSAAGMSDNGMSGPEASGIGQGDDFGGQYQCIRQRIIQAYLLF